jgi:NADP-dependent 3-hydroxy acid dehydrogenase YdfG
VVTASDHPSSLNINIGSIAGVSAVPYTVVYGGSKSFNLSFSKSLTAELKALVTTRSRFSALSWAPLIPPALQGLKRMQ